MPTLTNTALAILVAALPFLGFGAAALILHTLAARTGERLLKTAGGDRLTALLRPLRGSTRMGFLLIGLQLARAANPLPAQFHPLAHKLVALGWIATLVWLAVALGGVAGLWVQRTYDISGTDNLSARKMLTKARMFHRLYTVFVCVLALAAILMVFDATRNLGTSVLASAGIAGAVAGLSAQKLLSSLLAGAQIAFTQPIRLDDVVVVEGEWGRIEEIGMTYVVVRIWDERRLVLPTTYFLERPIQNWTRTSAAIMGTAFVHVDYRAPVGELREELARICREEAGALWDGKVCVLQVTEAGRDSLTLRALVSSADSSRNWDLRCLVRERLVDYLRTRRPEALPRTRLLLDAAPRRSKQAPDEQKDGATAPSLEDFA